MSTVDCIHIIDNQYFIWLLLSNVATTCSYIHLLQGCINGDLFPFRTLKLLFYTTLYISLLLQDITFHSLTLILQITRYILYFGVITNTHTMKLFLMHYNNLSEKVKMTCVKINNHF